MKKVFLRVTPSDKFYQNYKNLNLCYWAKDFKKKHYDVKTENFFNAQNNKNRIKRNRLSHTISLKIIKFLYNKLSNNFYKKLSKEEYEIILYPFIQSFTYMILDRKFMIDEFLLRNEIKKIAVNDILEKENKFLCNSSIDFLKVIQTEGFNNFLILDIFKRNKNLKIEIKKKRFKDNEIIIKKEKFTIISKLKNYLQISLSKFSYKFNKIVFESIYYPKFEFIKICLSFGIFPYKVFKLFQLNFSSNLDLNKRNSLKSSIRRSNFSKLEKMISDIIVNNIPKNYLENFNQIIKHLNQYPKKKKIITSISFYYNEIFRIFLVLARRNKTKIIQCDHGGGFSFQNIPNHLYIQKKIFDNFAVWGKHSHGKNISSKKKIFINPTLSSLNLNLNIDIKNHLSILFYESRKFTIEYDALQSFENQNKALNNLIYVSKKLPREIRDTTVFRTLRNYGLEGEKRFNREVLNSKKYGKNIELSKSFAKILKHSKLIICNFPSTSFSEALSFNIPTLLFCDENEILLDERSKSFFIKMKKNKMIFSNRIKLIEHIKKIWKDPNEWWMKGNIQNLRTNYLRNYFNVIDDLKCSWIKK